MKLCSDCIKNLTSAHNFVKQCERSEEKFRKTFINIKRSIKIEPEETVDKKSLIVGDEDINESTLDEKINLFEPSVENDEIIETIKHELDIMSGSDDSTDTEPLSTYLRFSNHKNLKTEKTENHNSNENTLFHRKKRKITKKIASHNCKICQKKFHRLYNLKRHMSNHDADTNPFECSICYRRFKREDLLIRHSSIHMMGISFDKLKKTDKSIKYKCDPCNLEFTSKNAHSGHMSKHRSKYEDPEKKYSCSECGKSFSKSSHLNRHIKIHSKEKPYPCTLCDKQYCRQDQLITHLNKHSGVKPNVCNICGKGTSYI